MKLQMRSPDDKWPRQISGTFQSLIASASVVVGVGALVILASLLCAPLAAAHLFLWGLAFFMGSVVVGFLFGIPRDASPGVNNNLVEISDWLTKIIVGLGLIELSSMPDHVRRITDFMVGLPETSPALYFTPSAAGATMLYFSAAGFFHGYLLTRLVLNLHLAQVTKSLEFIAKEIAAEVKTTSISLDEPALGETPLDPKLKEFAKVSPEGFDQPEDLATWAKVNLQLGNYSRAVKGYTEAAENLPLDARIAAELGIAKYKQGTDVETAFAQLIRAKNLLGSSSDPKLRRDIYKWLSYVSLYRPVPVGYEDALKYCAEYQALPNAEASAGLLVNKACALGQKYSYLSGNKADGETLAAVEASALDALRQALAAKPDYKARIRELLFGEHAGDDDLVVFKDRPSFRALVADASAST